MELTREQNWVSNDHFTVDGIPIEVWASAKSFRPKREPPQGPGSGNPWSEFAEKPCKNDTHASTTDPEAILVRKSDGGKARRFFGAHAVIESRHGLCVLLSVRNAVGEPDSTVAVDGLLELGNRSFTPKSVGADRGYHTETVIEELRPEQIVAHPSLMDSRYARGVKRNATWRASQKVRKRIEEIFGWMKTTGNVCKSRYRGIARTRATAQYVAADCNLVGTAKLMMTSSPKEGRGVTPRAAAVPAHRSQAAESCGKRQNGVAKPTARRIKYQSSSAVSLTRKPARFPSACF